ncbi:MAG TPA: TraB/GumN family protein [Sphingomicrobium sp.]|nr:TraB/GumN family protein [Sphingomicrobium sp.]
MLKTLFRRAVAALGLGALLVGAPAASKAPQAAQPALWQVSDADTTIYLFGTIHLLPEQFQWRTARFDQAVQNSQQLVVETIVDEKDPGRMMSAMASLAFNAPNLPPLMMRVPPEKRPALAAAVKKSGFPPQAFDRMETWAAAFILLGNQYREMNLKSEEGVEAVLRGSFASQGKPVGELETNLQQFGFFDRLPEKAQQALLVGALDEANAADDEFAGMLKAWSSGDVKAIARTFDRDLADSPDLAQALIHERNANWSRWIEQRMAQPGAVMIAVGAGHLAGRDSVIAMLQRDGYRVRRVQ